MQPSRASTARWILSCWAASPRIHPGPYSAKFKQLTNPCWTSASGVGTRHGLRSSLIRYRT
eukprot:1389166-Lingulodinium_polyedra.AAC.1